MTCYAATTVSSMAFILCLVSLLFSLSISKPMYTQVSFTEGEKKYRQAATRKICCCKPQETIVYMSAKKLEL